MPRGDRTGPVGRGPRTGRGLGYCAGYGEPGYMHPGPGYGYGRGMAWRRGWGAGAGWGRGRGWGGPWGYGPGAYDVPWDWPAAAPEAAAEYEVDALKSQARWLREQLDLIQARMDELSKPSSENE
ncbi:MAG: DUF5320 domain-containing protein [Anaerolineae bacterium]|nr:DUF5320 domain-containing protein [Anaerolineae bacterium]